METVRLFKSLWRPLQARRLQRDPRQHVLHKAYGNVGYASLLVGHVIELIYPYKEITRIGVRHDIAFRFHNDDDWYLTVKYFISFHRVHTHTILRMFCIRLLWNKLSSFN